MASTRFGYDFDKVPLEQGLRRIHSVEQYCKKIYNPVFPMFRLLNTSEPKVADGRVSIWMACKIFFDDYAIHMYTSKRTESNMVLYHQNCPALYVHMKVSSCSRLPEGHRLDVSMNSFQFLKFEMNVLQVFIQGIMCCDNHWLWTYDFGSFCDSRLSRYRRLVLFEPKKSAVRLSR